MASAASMATGKMRAGIAGPSEQTFTHEPVKRSRLLATAGVNLCRPYAGWPYRAMRWFGLLASVILVASLASCADTVGRNYAYGPGYGYGAGPEAFYCCGPRFERFYHFDHFRDHTRFHFHDGFREMPG
jgi:hypothetical protein